MSYKNPDLPVLRISSLRELLDYETEIVRRINAFANGGHLLLLHPQRLLRDVHVEMTDEAEKECRRKHPDLFLQTGREHAYDAVLKSNPQGGITVKVNGLFKKGDRA